jgi:hypothetical protein
MDFLFAHLFMYAFHWVSVYLPKLKSSRSTNPINHWHSLPYLIDPQCLDRVRLGALASIDAGTSGTYYFDTFESRRQTYIGP